MSPREPGAPERIWLQPETKDYRDGWTWCWHEIDEHDVAYLRADIAEAALREQIAGELEDAARRLWPPDTVITDRHTLADHDGYLRAAAFVREGRGKP